MKTLEAAIILPLILFIFALFTALMILAYLHSDRYANSYIPLTAEIREADDLVNQAAELLKLPALGQAGKFAREVELDVIDLKGGKLVDLLLFLQDEMRELKSA